MMSLVFFASCSSTPSGPGSYVTRSEYIQQANRDLNELEKKTEKLTADNAARVRAEIADARVDLRTLESAPESDWVSHQRKVQAAVERIDSQVRLAE